ncbi:hypothetical protein FJR48_02520 [Sulfurimonas lithotrophica]|uniref:Glycosyl transferase family 2 n=1 Tax=Sulfurimonas lithotrophica TaxID=2590022 RepID=A0A5P8NZ09_9BACT|nr:hypothetical protein [Sulfurimonas lithotrophica]QFR48656.1 hypothetical protein FJR48_02520 [Sulfurimonas lithotrophica]
MNKFKDISGDFMEYDGLDVIEIDSIVSDKLFSMCTLVSNIDEYKLLLDSAKKAGFNNDNTEFIYIDNTQDNKYDAYDGLNQCLNKANGKYLILVHQDVEFKFDNIEVLTDKIKEMNEVDPKWAILGNTGYDINDINTQYTRITDPGQLDVHNGPFPAKVSCPDENIMIVKNELNLMFSKNIGHYHLYGADLSMQAQMQGYHTYVIDFHILHRSGGYPNKSFYDTKYRMIKQYQKALEMRFFRTPCSPLFLSSFGVLNKIMNSKAVYSLKKRIDSLRYSKKHCE